MGSGLTPSGGESTPAGADTAVTAISAPAVMVPVMVSRASVLETLLTALTRLVLQTATYRKQRRSTQTDTKTSTKKPTRVAAPSPRLASDGVRYADARSSVGRRFRSATKLRLEWYGGVFLLLLLQQRSKPTRNGFNAQGANLTSPLRAFPV